MTLWSHDLSSSHLSVKWMSDSKSAPQITLESSGTRKKSAKVIDLIWPQLTSVDLRRTGWPCGKHEYYLGLHFHVHITSKNGDACRCERFEHASFERKSFERTIFSACHFSDMTFERLSNTAIFNVSESHVSAKPISATTIWATVQPSEIHCPPLQYIWHETRSLQIA